MLRRLAVRGRTRRATQCAGVALPTQQLTLAIYAPDQGLAIYAPDQGLGGRDADGRGSNHGLPASLLVLLRRQEVRVAVCAPRETVARQAQQLALPLFLATAPRLHGTVTAL